MIANYDEARVEKLSTKQTKYCSKKQDWDNINNSKYKLQDEELRH